MKTKKYVTKPQIKPFNHREALHYDIGSFERKQNANNDSQGGG